MLNPLARHDAIRQASGRQLLPVTLISGFLGAGKTTLLNSLLRQAGGRRLAVLVNDFGALNIDAQLIVKIDGQKVELANGCICCSIRDDLVAGINTLLDSDLALEQIVVETSGVSDPLNILCSLNTSAARNRIYLENVVTVVDATHALEVMEGEAKDLWLRQVRGAYMIVLNRVEATSPAALTMLRETLNRILPGCAIYETTDGRAPIALLLGDQRMGQSAFRPEPVLEESPHPFSSMVYRNAAPMRRIDFMRLMKSLSSRVYRVKGFVNFSRYPMTTLYQKVGSYESYADGGTWGVTRPLTELALIGSTGAFNVDEIMQSLDDCADSPADSLAKEERGRCGS